MESTLSATRVDPPFEGNVAPTVEKDRFTDVEEALQKLAHQAASDTPEAQPAAPALDPSADVRISQPPAAATLGPADLSAQIPREPPSPRKRRKLARVAIVVCLGASAIWAWRSYGGLASNMIATGMIASSAPPSSPQPAAEQMSAPQTPAPAQAAAVATPAPPPPQAAPVAQPATTAASAPAAASARRQQIETMARDLAALRQTVDRLAAGQEQLNQEIARRQPEAPQADKLRAEKPAKRTHRLSAPSHDAFDPAQNPTAPGVPRTLGSIVLPR